ncbi:seipin-2 [Humulus lupulus]|uniref:seipin-2 n=1 Tax=Humulus lupulus TaxID=3486 RepID=UPI002B40CE61|nr:seipin-2 [Humulus lupulus]
MELPTTNDNDNDNGEVFFEALDDFHVPFYDCPDSFSDQSESSSSSVLYTPVPKSPLEASSPAVTIRRRRSSSRRISHNDSSLDKSSISEIDSIEGSTKWSSKGKVCEIGGNLKENGEKLDLNKEPFSLLSDQSNGLSTVSAASEFPVVDSINSDAELDGSSSNLLIFVAGFVIKAIGFQFHLFIKFVSFPICVLYTAYMFVIDPFYTMRRGREYFIGKVVKLWDLVLGFASPYVLDWLKDNKSIEKVASRWFWGSLWAIYVCFILCCLLFLSSLFSGLIMRYFVEKPVHMKEVLNFDFTKHRPVAFMPIVSCVNAGCGMDCEEQIEARKKMGFRVIPVGHKLQASVSMTLPESEYNRNLGIFQVRLEFLSVKGETLSSSSHPCMLQFKSEPIRFLWTFLKAVPLVAGYVSESQTLNVKYKGFTEGNVPTGCLRVTIEQRAEYRAGAGIPEIYDASLVLESELPLLKRLLWRWKISIFIWITMTLFFMELLCALVCCNRIIMPRPGPRPRDSSISSGATQNNPSTRSGRGGLYRSAPLDAVDAATDQYRHVIPTLSFLLFTFPTLV